MEVTRTNFAALLPEIKESINNALFLAIDGEFTGLRTKNDYLPLPMDTPQEYYNKLRKGALDFLLIQFGLAIFEYDRLKDTYIYKAFSFFLFPGSFNVGRNVHDHWFMSQTSALDVLAKSNFDFNKVFIHGIPFLSETQRQAIQESLEERRRFRNLEAGPYYGDPIPIPPEFMDIVENAINEVKIFMRNDSVQNITLPKYNGYVRRIIFQQLKIRFSYQDLVFESDSTHTYVKKTGSVEQRMAEEKLKVEGEEKKLYESIGFSHVIEAISKSKKPIVGHNMLLDLMHVYKRFWKALPDDYRNFKALLHHKFPMVVDTKHMVQTSELRNIFLVSTGLQNIYEAVFEKPFNVIKTEPAPGYNLTGWKLHDAGFDAYITGVAYQTLLNYLGSLKSPNLQAPVSPNDLGIDNITNRVFLLNNNTFMNLVGEDPVVNRSHIFCITFPPDWRTGDIKRVFRPFGKVFIRWLEEGCALVTLQNKNLAPLVSQILIDARTGRNYSNSPFKIITYQTFVTSGGPRASIRPRGQA